MVYEFYDQFKLLKGSSGVLELATDRKEPNYVLRCLQIKKFEINLTFFSFVNKIAYKEQFFVFACLIYT